MEYIKLEIPEIVLCKPKINTDDRGFVFESFKRDSLNDFLGYKVDFCQDNILYNNYGVIRALHTNSLNYAQSKLVSVLKGKILDVVVDFRIGSPTFGKYICMELSYENKEQLFLPRGFLHGFSVLSEDAIVNIKIDRYFTSGEGIGVRYDDQDLNIDWKIPKHLHILSKADRLLANFKDVSSPFYYNTKLY